MKMKRRRVSGLISMQEASWMMTQITSLNPLPRLVHWTF